MLIKNCSMYLGYAILLSHLYAAAAEPPIARCFFRAASILDSPLLTQLVINSHNSYKDCITYKKVAPNFFDIPNSVYTNGIVEILAYNDEIIGFYSIKH